MSRTSRSNRTRELRRRLTYGIIAAGVCLTVFVVNRVNVAKENQKQVKSSAETKSAVSGTENIIGKVLQKDAYGQQLGALYDRYPEASEIILNRERYPDTLIDYLIGHTEALEWVIGYPDYMEKGADEINKAALEPVDRKDYYVQKNVPLYFQWDPAWGYASYGTGQIAIDGCGPTALSMVVTGLTGDAGMTPKKIADYSASQGYFNAEEGTSWSLMQDGAAGLGLSVGEVAWKEAAVLGELAEGHPIICSMGPGDFTDKGHFIVLCGTAPDAKILVNDPNSKVNSRKKWELSKLMGQMKSMWSYTAADQP